MTFLAIEAALAAGEVLRQGYGTRFSVKHKEGDVHNLVTEYDLKAEAAIIQLITRHAPDSRFLAEESGTSGEKQAPLLWIVDPLDGTVNFAHHIPNFAVSIGLEKEGQLFCGVVYQPITHELFVAEKGLGSFLNGDPLSVTKTSHLNRCILATGFPYNLAENPNHCIEHFIDILKAGIPIRRLGAAAIDFAYTAAGRFDGFFEVSLAPWDCAAGVLLVEEAGGKVTEWDGAPFDLRAKKSILATNGHIHPQTIKLLHRV
ncbi:MAG: inositol monophosphatase [Verrucomicrobiota bacterium]|nr:inositol monophosphatase [Verrucomicrobiota bacterium]